MLDAAARHLSFTRAADELAVTPAAVGQHMTNTDSTPFMERLQRSELAYVTSSEAGGRVLAENYVGLPFDD